MVDIVLCVHHLPPRPTSAPKTFDMTLCDNVHSGDAVGSFVYLFYCSESTVGSCWLGLIFGGFRCF